MFDVNMVIGVALALKPLADIAEEFDRQNTHRPDNPASEIIYELGDVKLTLQHCFNAHRVLEEMKNG